MKRLLSLAAEILQILLEGTVAGAIRYIRFKRLVPVIKNQWVTSARQISCGMGIVGAGNYVASVHLPCLYALGEPVYAVASRSEDSARALAKVYNIGVVYPGLIEMAIDPCCQSLLIGTPHYLHSENIITALNAGKYTYCEKPVAINREDLERLEAHGLAHTAAFKVMIGFNRRFSPAAIQLKQMSWLKNRAGPIEIQYRVNFGPRVDNMMSDAMCGGGRIHGAACHYVDMLAFLADSSIVQVSALAINGDNNTFAAVMKFDDGSLASLTFTSEGNRFQDIKEEILISCDQHTARIRNYSELRVDGRSYKFQRHIYGGMAAMRAFLEAKDAGTNTPISLADGIAATQVTLAIEKSLKMNGEPQLLKPVIGALKYG